jgi:hypothetical protein
MLRTEEEARACWCPFARVVVDTLEGEAATSANRSGSGSGWAIARCIASACMAWRLGPVTHAPRPDVILADDSIAVMEPRVRPANVPPDWDWVPHSRVSARQAQWREPSASVKRRYEEAKAKRPGFCGLAGKVKE